MELQKHFLWIYCLISIFVICHDWKYLEIIKVLGFPIIMCFSSYFPFWCNQIIVLLKIKLIQLCQGGGWCNNVRTCVYRKKTRRGSSLFMEKEIPFTGILSNKPEENPGYHSIWSTHILIFFFYICHRHWKLWPCYCLQIFSIGIEWNFVIATVAHLLGMVKIRYWY
jgi:hypothetical protein